LSRHFSLLPGDGIPAVSALKYELDGMASASRAAPMQMTEAASNIGVEPKWTESGPIAESPTGARP
jgi:hypothetical protein